MNKKVITINGVNFSDLETFFCEIDNLLTKDLDWKTGHNLNAFNDLLWGGFGVYEYEEKVIMRCINFAESKENLGEEIIQAILEMINTHEHIDFSFQD